MCTSAFAHNDSAHKRHVRHCTRRRPPLPSPSPTLRSATRATGSQRRDLFPTAARTLPGSGRRANDILYIRVRRREGENVLHKVGRNDVDNFSVDNPLWITATAGCRSLRGRRRRPCGGSVNAGAEVRTRTVRVRKSFGGRPKGMRGGKCERRGGNINADAANAEVFAGDGCSQGASFGPMAAISRRWRGGRIYNNTRTRERQRRKCVKPAAPTTHSPSKICSRPRTTTRPARAFSHSLPAHFRSPPRDDARLPTSQHIPRRRSAPAPAQRRALPEHFLTPSPRRRTPAGCAMHSSPPSQHIPRRRPPLAPAQRRALPGHFLTPFPRTSAPPPRDDARPPTSPPIPRRRSAPVPAQRHALPEHFLIPFPCPPDTSPQPRRTPAGCAIHSSSKISSPPPPFRFGHKKTAPHSGCAMPNVSVDRRCGRSLGLVSRALFAAVAGRWRGA